MKKWCRYLSLNENTYRYLAKYWYFEPLQGLLTSSFKLHQKLSVASSSVCGPDRAVGPENVHCD